LAALVALAATAAVGAPAAAADLTTIETRWLQAGLPVLAHARSRALPVDVVVQPQPTPGHAPLAMDFVEGRCKLVLSMRGNPDAEAPLAHAPPELHAVAIEAITAHEVAHCWRHVRGRWNVLPAGFAETASNGDAWRAMRATRREEGYADLAALAWVLGRHPDRYAQVHDWLERVRDDQPVPGSHHDTRAWIRLARNPQAFPPDADPFEQAQALWPQGLDADEAAH
jgi:hypothetical protein